MLELLIGLAILGLLFGLSLPFTLTFYRRYQVDSERTTFVSLMRQARTRALGNVDSSAHGVAIASESFTLFEGTSYATRAVAKDEAYGRSSTVTIIGPSEIVFRPLSGKSSSASFTFDNGIKQVKIYVNTEGRIDW